MYVFNINLCTLPLDTLSCTSWLLHLTLALKHWTSSFITTLCSVKARLRHDPTVWSFASTLNTLTEWVGRHHAWAGAKVQTLPNPKEIQLSPKPQEQPANKHPEMWLKSSHLWALSTFTSTLSKTFHTFPNPFISSQKREKHGNGPRTSRTPSRSLNTSSQYLLSLSSWTKMHTSG